MRLVVKATVLLEVEVKADAFADAKTMVEMNWDVYRHQAEWYRGTPPELTATDIQVIKKAAKDPVTVRHVPAAKDAIQEVGSIMEAPQQER
jgi:hypothetical protein